MSLHRALLPAQPRPPRSRVLRPVLLALSAAMLAGCVDKITAADDSVTGPPPTTSKVADLVTHEELLAALVAARREANGGFNLDMWGAVVDRLGFVVAVAYTGTNVGDQWYGSRVIAAQKANTGMAFSLPGLALSTANLYAATQPGGSLFGLQESNPVNTDAAYGGKYADFGTEKDYMIGKRIGGINVFGGGLALYTAQGEFIGGLGVSGDASCADHNIAWKVRNRLGLDHVPAGVSGDPARPDNIVYDFNVATGTSSSGWGHPTCSAAATQIAATLPPTAPIAAP